MESSSSSSSCPPPPQTPPAKPSSACNPAASSSSTTFGPLLQVAGNECLNTFAKSNSFPLVNHPAFSGYALSSGRSEFGGLGSLGLSAFAAHPQFGAFPDWLWTSETHASAASVLLPPLLGLHPLFASTLKNHDPSSSQSHTSAVNGIVNGTNGSSLTGHKMTSLFPQKEMKEKTQVNSSPKSIHNQDQPPKKIERTKEKKPSKQLPQTSSLRDSRSGSLSDTSSDDKDSSSDADDMEEEEEEEDNSEEKDDESNYSEDSDSATEGQIEQKVQNMSERKKKKSCTENGNPAPVSHHDPASLTSLFHQASSSSATSPPSATVLLHSSRTTQDNQQHISVIQATGIGTSNTLFAQSTRDVSPLASRSSPNTKTLSSSPKQLLPPTSPKHFSQMSSSKHRSVSSPPKPLALCSPKKPTSLGSSPESLLLASSHKLLSFSSAPKPTTQSTSQKSAFEQRLISPKDTGPLDNRGKTSEENTVLFNRFRLRHPIHSKDPFPQAFPWQPSRQNWYKCHRYSPELTLENCSQLLSLSCNSENSLFLNHRPYEATCHEVQDAPLALVKTRRTESSTFNCKILQAATGTSCLMPMNLSTKSSSSMGAIHGSKRSKAAKSLSAQSNVSKSCTSCPAADLVRGSNPDAYSSRDSESDSLGDDIDEDELDDIEEQDSVDSPSESESNLESDSEDGVKEHSETEAESDADRIPPKDTKVSFSSQSSSSSSSSSSHRSPNGSLLNLQVIKPPNLPGTLFNPPALSSLGALSNHSSFTLAGLPGSVKRRRVTDERFLQLPLEFGWRRETRIRTAAGRLQGEVAYLAPCGKKLRQYPDVMKYLLRNGITEISRDNFSFSTKIKVGDFYEAREKAEGLHWVLLSEEEIVPRIIAMDRRRTRRLKPEHHPASDGTGNQQWKAHPINIGKNNVQDVNNAKLLRKLEAQEIARQAAQIKLMRKLEKQAMARAAKEARKQQAIMAAEEKRKKREQIKILKQQEKIKRIQQIRMEKELRAQQILEAKRKKKQEAANARILEAEKRIKEKEMQRLQAVILKHQEVERLRLDMERERRRQHMMLMKAIETRKKAEEKERLRKEKKDKKRWNKERKLELKRLELEKAKELKKPNEDMCLADQKLLPDLSPIPGLVLSGSIFSDCLMVLQFLRCFGKVLGLNMNINNLTLSDLQGGLLSLRESVDKVQDLLVSLLSVAVHEPGIPAGHRNKTSLGEHIANVEINRDNVSEILQIYMEAHCERTELAALAVSLGTKAFQAHSPHQKASILAFLVNELCCNKVVISEIDKSIDDMTNLRKDKWVVEGKLRKLRRIHTKRTGQRDNGVGGENSHTVVIPNAKSKCKQKEGDSDEEEDEDDDSEDQGDEEDEEEEESVRRKVKKAEICEDELRVDDCVHSADIVDLEKQIEKMNKQQSQIRQKLFESSHSLRSMMIGQDRYKRRYWLLPQCGAIFVEGVESSEGCEEIEKEENTEVIKMEEEQMDETQMSVESIPAQSTKRDAATLQSQHVEDSFNLFLQKPGSLSKLSKLLQVAKMAQDSHIDFHNSRNCHSTKSSATATYASCPASQTGTCQSPLLTTADQEHLDKMDTAVSPLLSAPQLSSSPLISLSPQPVLQDDQLSKMMMEKSSQWFQLLPRSPCDESSVTSGSSPQVSSSSPQTTNNKSLTCLSPIYPPVTASYNTHAINNRPIPQQVKSGSHQSSLTMCNMSSEGMTSSLPFNGISLPPVLDLASNGTANSNTVNKTETPEALCDKPSRISSPAVDVAKTQDYPRPQPVPDEMLHGWWRVSNMEELHSLVKALHCRGIREKVLQKQIQKHMEYVTQLYASSKDVIDVSEMEKQDVSEKTVESWIIEEQAMKVDISLLRQVEALERRVISANLQVKGWMPAEPQSGRDLVYHEHKLVSSAAPENKIQREFSPEEPPGTVVRRPNNPLDIAVIRLAELESNIERSKEELAPGMRLWHKALSRVRSAAQLSLCIQQLQRSVAWDRSIIKVHCHLCGEGDNEELLLLCDGCDRGCHTYCHKPRITTVPDGDWFCPTCTPKERGQSPWNKTQQNQTAAGEKRRSEVKLKSKPSVRGELIKEAASSRNVVSKKGSREFKKRKGEDNQPGSHAEHDSPVSCAKRVKITKDDTNGLACCVLLAELEAHQDAWPFLTPVNHKAVPGYKKVIKKPMDFSTIREKLQNNQYPNLEPFIIDVNLVFDNCEKFNEDDSAIGRAGHNMRRFFDKRWTEMLT